MAVDLLIRGGTVVHPDGVRIQDIAVENETIVELGQDLHLVARNEMDAREKHVFPGCIDAHVHFNEPGRTEWEGIATGSAALAAGGGTCFFDMPLNSSPPTLDGESFDRKLAACQASSVTDFALWGGLTPRNLDRMEELADRGVIGFKAFMCRSGIDDFEYCDDWTLYQGLEIAAQLELPVAVHAENDAITAGLAARLVDSEQRSAHDYLASRPVFAELEAIRRVMLMAAETGARLHIVHVSNAQCVREIREFAAQAEIQVTCETCPHYLLLTAIDAEQQGAVAKCAPPLRAEPERLALLNHVHAGDVDTIGSDHSPAPPDRKGLCSSRSDAVDSHRHTRAVEPTDFFAMWGGISGVQLTLSSLLTLDVDPSRIVQLVGCHVARCFSLSRKGSVGVGMDADLAIVDLSHTYQLTADRLLCRHRLSPYLGRVFRGAIERTLVRGRTVFQDKTVEGHGWGRLVTVEK